MKKTVKIVVNILLGISLFSSYVLISFANDQKAIQDKLRDILSIS